MRQSFAPFVAIVFGALLSGCEQPDGVAAGADADLSTWIGKTVEVQFRRDALGAAADLPISPETGSINGASTAVYGKLMEMDASGITIERNNHLKWIPREVILYIQKSP